MSIRILPAHHRLLVENGLQEFDDEGQVLAILDDHGPAADQPEPRLTTIALPRPDNTGIERELERWAPRIREHTILDCLEALDQVLMGEGRPSNRREDLLSKVRALVDQPRVPAGWTAWAEIPPGSISAFGDGQYLLRWPSPNERKLDAARFFDWESVEDDPDSVVTGPEFTFNPARPSVPWVKVLQTGLTAEGVSAIIEAPDGELVEQTIARLYPAPEAT